MIANGFPPDYAWSMTPKQLTGFGFMIHKRKQREARLALQIATLGNRGDKKALDEIQKDLDS